VCNIHMVGIHLEYRAPSIKFWIAVTNWNVGIDRGLQILCVHNQQSVILFLKTSLEHLYCREAHHQSMLAALYLAKNRSGSHLNKLGYNNRATDVVGTLTRSCIVIQQHLVSLCYFLKDIWILF
ncbi:hypothetical protein ACJX0J_023411, partial [Zea mays]